MQETVKFDLLGERRIVFTDEALTHITNETYLIPLPGDFIARTIVKDRPIRYDDIHRVGLVRRKQWWALVLGALFTSLGPTWIAGAWGDQGALIVTFAVLLLLGLFPLWLFVRGRPFLVIASGEHAICLPMDRQKRQVRRVIALLGESLKSRDVAWEMEDAPWDDSPGGPGHRPMGGPPSGGRLTGAGAGP
jgi:hypothetical protein